jgi:DNA processing protein
MQADERAAWLRLALTPGIGPVSARALLREFGLPGALFDGSVPRARLAEAAGEPAARALRGEPPREISAALERTERWLAEAPERFLLSLADADYPPGLLQLGDAPILLYGHGRRELLGMPAIAIVGSRGATRQGAENAASFAACLGRAGLCIVSGMARGIDAAAHRGALDAGCATIAVLGTGCDRVYPASHRALAAELASRGLLLTEFELGARPLADHFPRRNRLIAALSRGVLVVEAALHSGSLITARIGAELGREVFAIPGSIHSPQARGCHRLIRDGAKLVESAQDVLEELRWPMHPPAPSGAAAADGPALQPGHARLLEAIGHDPADIDTLCRRTALDPGSVAAMLLELELAGDVERVAGDRYQRLRASR